MILDLDSFQGEVSVFNNLFSNNTVKYSSACELDWSCSKQGCLENSLLYLNNHKASAFVFSNTFSDNLVVKGLVQITRHPLSLTDSKALIVVEKNKFIKNSGILEGTGVIVRLNTLHSLSAEWKQSWKHHC